MKFVTALSLLLVVVFSNAGILDSTDLDGVAKVLSKHIAIGTEEGMNHPEYLIPNSLLNLLTTTTEDESAVTFFYHSGKAADGGVAVTRTTSNALSATDFTPSRHTMFLIHGYNSTVDGEFVTTVRNAMVDNLDVNIFVVNWRVIASDNYISSIVNALSVGKFIAKFIEELVANHGLSLSDVTLVGHSMGAHVAGNAGSYLHGQLSAIVALDAAQPLVMFFSSNIRLDSSDARFVQAIHTNGGYYGSLYSVGHADYYVNGGSSQPGCSDPNCSHDRSFYYYAESLASDGFVGRSCPCYAEYVRGECDSNPISVMGTCHIDTSASGDYYLDTNSASPFAKG